MPCGKGYGHTSLLVYNSCRVNKYDLVKSAVQGFAIKILHNQALIETDPITDLDFGCRSSDPETLVGAGKFHVGVAWGVQRRQNLAFVPLRAGRGT